MDDTINVREIIMAALKAKGYDVSGKGNVIYATSLTVGYPSTIITIEGR